MESPASGIAALHPSESRAASTESRSELTAQLTTQQEPERAPARDRDVAITLPLSPTATAGLRRRLFAGRAPWALSDQALVSGANFVTNVLLARAFGPSDFGVFVLCWMVLLLMSSLQTATITLPMMSIGPKQEPDFRPAYYGAVTLQQLTLATIAGAAVLFGTLGLGGFFPAWRLGPIALPLAAATVTYLVQDYARRYFFTLGRSPLALLCDALSYLTQLPLLWWFAAHHRLTLPGALWLITVTSLLSVLLCLPLRGRLRFSRHAFRTVVARHWSVVRWLTPAALLQWASLNLFVIFAPVYYGPAAAGALRACQNVVAVAHIWFLGLDNVLPTEAARHFHEDGIDASLNYIRRMLLRWGLVTLGFMLVVNIAPGFWLHLLYGGRYIQYGYILRLYTILYLMTFIGGPLRAGLQAIEYTAPLLWSYAAMTLFALIFAAPMARRLGLSGAMLGLMATQLIFQSILAVALLARARRMRRETSIPPSTA